MEIAWGWLWEKSRNRLKAAWLITASIVAIYIGAVEPINEARSVAEERGSGLAAVAGWQPTSMWHQMRPMHAMLLKGVTGVVGGVPGGIAQGRGGAYFEAASVDRLPVSTTIAEERKMVRTGTMDLVVRNPHDTAEKIRQLAEHAGGFLVNSEVYGGQQAASASLQIRVPVSRFEEVRTEIRNLGLHVESEKLNAEDVTKQYVDQGARLRNLRAQETQYLGILKQAKTVKDTTEVSEKLDEIRGEIETQQAEFDALSKQVETVALTVSLQAEAEVRVFGLHWRPVYQLKLAARQGLESIGDYAASMASFLFYFPTVILWLATILIGAAAGWRVLKWAGKALFAARVKPA